MHKKKTKTKLLVFFLLLFNIFLFTNNKVLAHPGNTASDGCHYCRTNCDRWGVPWNQRHCHGGGVLVPVQQTQKVIYPTSTPISTIYIKPTNTSIPAPTSISTLTPTSASTSTVTMEPTRRLDIEAAPMPTPKESFWRRLIIFLFNL